MNIEEAAQRLGMKENEVVRVERAKNGEEGHLVLTFDGNVVHVDDDGGTHPRGRVSDQELAEAKLQAQDREGPAASVTPDEAKVAAGQAPTKANPTTKK